MEYNLFDFFGSIDDPRRAQGVRHSLPVLLSIIVMAILSGYKVWIKLPLPKNSAIG